MLCHTSMSIPSIPDSFRHANFNLKLLKRDGLVALYGDELRKYFEVHIVKVAKASTIMGRSYPDREILAGSEEFGKRAWCSPSRERAEDLFLACLRDLAESESEKAMAK